MPRKESPTPYMDKVHTKSKTFTYAENRLLDQITLEITEAWQNDLQVLKKHFREVEKIAKSTKNIVDILDEKLPALNKFLGDNDFILNFKKMTYNFEAMNSRQAELDKTIFELEKKINFEYVTSLMKSIKTLEEMVKALQKQVQEPWWKKIFRR
jgi:hypothetical protein